MIHWFDGNFCMTYKYLITIFISLIFLSCGSTVSNDKSNELSEEEKTELKNDTSKKGFKLYVPSYMEKIEDLHESADAQFVYIEEESANSDPSGLKEHFLIVLSEKKTEIENYAVPVKPTLQSYHQDAIETMRMNEAMLKFNVEDSVSAIQQINGCQVIVSEITALTKTFDEPIELYYKIAIIEGKKAFYQVITWCPLIQKPSFYLEMDKIVQSFQEL